MPCGWFTTSETERQTPPPVGRPRRNRSKNKAQRQARKRCR